MQIVYATKDTKNTDNATVDNLIILHGLFGNGKNWTSLAKLWSQDFCVHRLNARNHALSFASSQMNYQLMAQDVVNYIQANNLAQAHIVGHSMGGKTAMLLTHTRPDLVKSLTILDISNGAYPPHHTKVLQSLQILNSQGWKNRAQALDALQHINLDLPTKEFLLTDLARDKNQANNLFLQMNLANIQNNYTNLIDKVEIDNIQTKTMLLAGSKSNYIDEKNLANMRLIFANLEFEVLTGGHWLNQEAQDDVYKKILNFCKS